MCLLCKCVCCLFVVIVCFAHECVCHVNVFIMWVCLSCECVCHVYFTTIMGTDCPKQNDLVPNLEIKRKTFLCI